MITKNCKVCNKEFDSYPSRKRLHCSRKCGNKNKKGTFKKGHKWVGKLKNPRRVTANGYIEVYSPKHPYKSVRNSVLEHRLVMEQKIRRYLLPKEVVHHINGVKDDNRIENLQLFATQSDHIVHEYLTSSSFRKSVQKNQFKKKPV